MSDSCPRQPSAAPLRPPLGHRSKPFVCADIVGTPSLEVFDNGQTNGADGFTWFEITKELAGKRAIIIALHGLFSTDVGTFDGIRQALAVRLRDISGSGADAIFRQRYEFVGWPHDTLRRISDNAAGLARLIDERIGPRGPDIIFLCHSRGGIVARAVAARLLSSRGWRKKVRGILTFGTPHEGAELAESSVGQESLAYLLLGSSTSWRRALPNFLVYLGHLERQRRAGHIDGVRKLAPLGNGYSTFLSDLMDAERKIGRASRPPVFAVGGDVGTVGAMLSSMGRIAGRHMKGLIDGHIGETFQRSR